MSDPKPKMDGQQWVRLQHEKTGGHPNYPLPPSIDLPAGAHSVVTVREVQMGAPDHVMEMSDASVTLGIPLRHARKIIGGEEGFITDPMTGERVAVSLAPGRNSDPDRTLIQIELSIGGACVTVPGPVLPNSPVAGQSGHVPEQHTDPSHGE